MDTDYLLQQLNQDCGIFREIVISIEENLYSELTGYLFCELIKNMQQNAEIHVVLHPEIAIEYLLEGKLLLFAILTRPYGARLKPVQADKMVFVEMGLMKLYAFYDELLVEVKDRKR